MAAGGSGAVKINRMAWQGIVSHRAEPQAVLDVIHPTEGFDALPAP